MKGKEAVSYIHSVSWMGSRPGLERIGELCEKGYVTEISVKSGYKNKIELTEKGRAAAIQINEIILNINNFVRITLHFYFIESQIILFIIHIG